MQVRISSKFIIQVERPAIVDNLDKTHLFSRITKRLAKDSPQTGTLAALMIDSTSLGRKLERTNQYQTNFHS